jgi:beta-phosphoglucomutase-like phosphatase (HAD superfamily)
VGRVDNPDDVAFPAGMAETPDHWRWRAGPAPPGPAVVFDMDGVLSDASRRQHFLEYPRRDWEAFFEACGDDELIDEVGRLLEVLDGDLAIVLLTARPLRVRPQTLAWLDRYQLRWDLLIMREWGDYSASRAFKKEAVNDLRAHGFDLRLAFEDDRRNVEMFHGEGVPCVYIHSGYYD